MWVSFSHQITSPFTFIVQHHHLHHHYDHHRHHQIHPVCYTHQQQLPAQHVPHQPHYVRCKSCGLHDSHTTWYGRGVQHSNCNELSSKAFLMNNHIELIEVHIMVQVTHPSRQCNWVQNMCRLIQCPYCTWLSEGWSGLSADCQIAVWTLTPRTCRSSWSRFEHLL